ncbi:MAG: ADP-ribosylglycohydrolase family protein [Gemmatimonadota bacterium]
MSRPTLTLAARARGALLGLAAPASPDLPLALILAEELLRPDIDVRRIAHRWAGHAARSGAELDPATRLALAHIAERDAPPHQLLGPPSAGPLARVVPVAIRAWATPANLASGSYHLVALTHPDPITAWAAVAVNMALAEFLRGRRDFLADVIAVLRNNDAPPELLQAARRVPRLIDREELAAPGGPAAAMEAALWVAHHEPDAGRGLDWLEATGRDATTLAVAGALLGARDGERGLPAGRVDRAPDRERIVGLAERLVGQRSGAT